MVATESKRKKNPASSDRKGTANTLFDEEREGAAHLKGEDPRRRRGRLIKREEVEESPARE